MADDFKMDFGILTDAEIEAMARFMYDDMRTDLLNATPEFGEYWLPLDHEKMSGWKERIESLAIAAANALKIIRECRSLPDVRGKVLRELDGKADQDG